MLDTQNSSSLMSLLTEQQSFSSLRHYRPSITNLILSLKWALASTFAYHIFKHCYSTPEDKYSVHRVPQCSRDSVDGQLLLCDSISHSVQKRAGKGWGKDAISSEQWIMEQDNDGFLINWSYPNFFYIFVIQQILIWSWLVPSIQEEVLFSTHTQTLMLLLCID